MSTTQARRFRLISQMRVPSKVRQYVRSKGFTVIVQPRLKAIVVKDCDYRVVTYVAPDAAAWEVWEAQLGWAKHSVYVEWDEWEGMDT